MPTNPVRIAVARSTFASVAGCLRHLACSLLLTLAGWGPAAAQEAKPRAARLRDLTAPPAKAPGEVEVFIDFAVILQIAGEVSAIVVGNATIADAIVVAAGTIALTGKAVGTTNVVVLRPDGMVLSDLRVQVTARTPRTVTVRRAILASSYTCTSASCQPPDGGTDAAAGATASPQPCITTPVRSRARSR